MSHGRGGGASRPAESASHSHAGSDVKKACSSSGASLQRAPLPRRVRSLASTCLGLGSGFGFGFGLGEGKG